MLDVPAKLSAQVRVFATGNGRKTDSVDAHSVAMVALRTPNLVRVVVDDDLVDETAKVVTIGAVREADIHDECSSLVPVEGPRSS